MVRQENIILHVDPDVGVRPVEGRGHVYELRTYRGHPGEIAAWLRAFKEVLPAREKYSNRSGSGRVTLAF